MNDLITLLKADLINTYKLNGLKDKSNRKKAIGMSLLALFLTAIAFLYIGGAAYLVSDILKSMGLLNILLVFAFALPFLVLFISVFT
jgi:cation transporter-like permease